MFGTTQRRSVTTTGRFRSHRPRNLVGIDLEEKTLQPQDKPFYKLLTTLFVARHAEAKSRVLSPCV